MENKELNTQIRSQKKLNQTLRMFGVPFPLWIVSFFISIISYNIFRYYALILILPLYIFIGKIGRMYSKKGKQNYLRSFYIKKTSHNKLYKNNTNILDKLWKK